MKTRTTAIGLVLVWSGVFLPSCDDSTTPSAGPPSAPTNLVASATSASRIDLTWQDNSDDEEAFAIERCTGAACTGFTQIAIVGNATSYEDQGLTGGTYRYQVRASNAEGYSSYSNTATATINVTTPPAAPSNVGYELWYCTPGVGRCEPPYGYHFAFFWQDNGDNEEGFALERCSGAGCTGFTEIVTVPANTTRYGGPLRGTYRYRVRAYNAAGYSSYSNTVTVNAGPPLAPTNLVAAEMSASQIDLTWQDNSNDERNFGIERCSGAGCTGFTRIVTVAANTAKYQDQGLTGGTSYSYRVLACNLRDAPCSVSNTATATTP